ncbi:MAG: MATE family efflux transporter [Cyclobacteriaceae bacterium]|nr:MATE family efflux transporter [Cyclobacteriaceae bacterium]
MISNFRSHFSINLRLAFPVMLSQLGQMTVHVADSMMVGRLGKDPLAGVSFANSIFVIFLVMGIGLSYAITPQTAQADGEKNTDKLAEILKNGLLINVVFGILLTTILLSWQNLLWNFKQQESVVKLALPYFNVIAISLIPHMIYQAFRQFAEGLGHTRQAMYIIVFSNLLNIGLNYIFIFGKLGVTPMGAYGAGLATLIARVTMAILMGSFVLLNHRFIPYRKAFSFSKYKTSLLLVNLKLGLPIAFQLILEITAFSIAAIMIGWMGSASLAAHQITINMASITYMVAVGIASAATIRVGNQLGKKDYKSMRDAALTSFIMSGVFMAFMALAFFGGRFFLPGLYISDPEVIQKASVLMIVAGLFQLSDGIQVVGLAALRGMSDVKIPSLIALLSYWMIGLPVGYVLGFTMNLGAQGIWFGLMAGLTVAGILLFIRFDRLSRKLLHPS